MQDIILLGKPNVGKSSLFNSIIKKRLAITSDISGTTRDIKKIKCDILGKKACIIDSGGLDESTELFKDIKALTLNQAKNADILLYILDGKKSSDEDDKKILHELLKLKKPLALVINKIDNQKDELKAFEFNNYGIKDVFHISVAHNSGIYDLLAWINIHLNEPIIKGEESLEEFLEHYEKDIKNDIDDNNIKVGIIGRVNVGKSSLLNALVKKPRSIVSPISGTTIDPVNESIVYKDKNIEFIDTAGIRKRGKIKDLEYYALNRTKEILKKAQIALLILDLSEGFNELDEKISSLIDQNHLATIIVLNKIDISTYDYDKIIKELRLDRFKFLAHAPIVSISAKMGKRINKLLDLILEVYNNFIQKIPTAKLNEIIQEATKAHPLPHDKGKAVKIYYVTQYDIAPPKIALIMNRPKALHFSYKRYLNNQIRKHFKLNGVPLILDSKKKSQKNEE